MYKIDYNYQDSIIRLTLSGSISMDLIEEIAKELYLNSSEKNILLLTDARGVKYDFNFEDFASLMDLINKFIKRDLIIHEAILIDSPRETAISTLFEIEQKRENHFFKIFSTEEAAIAWLFKNKK